MTAMATGNRNLREQQEKDAVRLLCSNLIPPETRVYLVGQLAGYRFAHDLTNLVYEEIAAMGAVTGQQLREHLPARMTNRGFPEFELNHFLGRRRSMNDEIEKWLESLLNLIEDDRTPGEKALGQSA